MQTQCIFLTTIVALGPYELDNFLMTYRSTAHSTTGVSPSSLFLRRELRTRFDILRPDTAGKQLQQKAHQDRHAVARQLT